MAKEVKKLDLENKHYYHYEKRHPKRPRLPAGFRVFDAIFTFGIPLYFISALSQRNFDNFGLNFWITLVVCAIVTIIFRKLVRFMAYGLADNRRARHDAEVRYELEKEMKRRGI